MIDRTLQQENIRFHIGGDGVAASVYFDGKITSDAIMRLVRLLQVQSDILEDSDITEKLKPAATLGRSA